MHEGLGRPQVEELRQLRSRVAKLEHDDARRRDIEEAYRLLVDHSLQGLMLLQEERIVFANQAVADITGYGTDELLASTLEQVITFIHPEDRPMVRQRYEDRLQGLPVPGRYEFRATHRDGSLHWLEIHAGLVEYRGRPATQIALTDVTARKHTELTLCASESKLKSIFRAAYVGIGLLSNRVLLEVNDRFCEMLGYRREELIGQGARMLYSTQEEYDYVGREKYGQIEKRGAGAVETRWRRKDGGIVDVLVGSIPLDPEDLSKGVSFTALDITERKRAEEALRESRAKLQTVLDSSPCAIVVSDLESRVVETNAVGLNMFGVRSRDQAVGRSLFEFVSPSHWDRVRDYTARTLRDGLVQNVEHTLLTGDGREFIGEVSSSLLRDASGSPCGFVTVTSDVTARKRSEDLMRIQHDLAVSLGAVGDLEEGLRLCLQAALDASGLDCGAVYLRDEPSGGLDMPCHMGLSGDFVAQVSHYDREAANTRVVMGGRPVYATFEKLGVPLDGTALREGLQAIAVIPILHRDQVIGCLNVASHSLVEVPPYSRSILETIASQIGGTIARLKAEEEARRERELLDRIADTSPAGITVVDRKGRLKFANPRAAEILGVTREQIAQRIYNAPAWHITDYDGGPFPEEQLPFRQVLAAGQPVRNIRHAIEWPDGRRVLLSINAAPILDDTGQLEGVVTTLEDVTEQVRAEEVIKKERDFSELAINALPGIFYIFDENGQFLRWNKNLETVTGYSAQEIARQTAFDHVREDCRELMAQRMREVFSKGRGDVEVVFVSKAGTETPYYCQGFHTILDGRPCLIGVGIDITERRRAEEALRVSEERFRRVFKEGPVGMVLTSRDFGFFHANPAFCRMLGYEEQEMNGMTFLDVTHPEHRDADRQNVGRLWQGEIPCYRTEKRYLAKNGGIRWGSLSASLIQGREGKPLYALAIVEDITERKMAEEALKESERKNCESLEFNRRILNTSSIGIVTFRESGPCTFANEAVARIVGTSVDNLLTQNFHQIQSWKRSGMYEAALTALRTGTEQQMETHVTSTFGKDLWLSIRFSCFPARDERHLLGFMYDITERKRSERLTRILHDLAVSLGAVGNLEEGLRLCLQAALDASGLDCGAIYLRDEPSGSLDMPCHVGLSDDFVAQVSHFDREAANTRVVMGGRPVYATFENLGVPLDETTLREGLRAIAVIPIMHRDRIIGCLNVASHSLAEVPPYSRSLLETIASQIGGTIARLKAEQALRESEQRFRTLFEAAPDAIYLSDLEGHLVDGNKAAEQLVGAPRDELIGRNLLEIGLLSQERTPIAAAGLKANAEGKAAGPDEYTIKTRNDACLTLEAKTFPIKIEDRTLVLGIARDITERKLAEEQAREHHEHLLHVSRLSTLGEMASGLAHELNQPLSAILSYAEASRRTIERQDVDREHLRTDLDRVVSQAKRAGEIVKRVRAFAQRRPTVLRPANINEIVRETLAFLHFEMVHKEIQVVLDLSESLPRVLADAVQLEQALLNLVRNAIEAMETTKPAERRLTIRTAAPDTDTVKVTVSDTGAGLPPEIRGRVFDSFFTTKPDGLGVGLSITRTLIELHRGQLWVEPGQGPGCTFAFTLPAALEDSTAPRGD